MLRRGVLLWAVPAMVALAVAAVLAATWSRWLRGEVPVLELRRERFVHAVSAEGILKAAKSTPLIVPMTIRSPLKIA